MEMERDQTFVRLQDAAVVGIDAFMAFMAYEGSNNKDRLMKAKLGVAMVSNYSRVRATRANEQSLRLLSQRLASGAVVASDGPALAAHQTQALTDGSAKTPGGPDAPAAAGARRNASKSR